MAYSQRWGEQRWPEVPPDRDAGPPPRTGRRRPELRAEPEDLDYADDESSFGTAEPAVNPYAVIALVAALVLLFPVAIVFGLIAFTRPRGRFMAFAAFLLGALEAVLLVAWFVLPGERVSDMYSRVGDALGVTTGSETAAGVPADGELESATAVSIPAPPSAPPASPTQPLATGAAPENAVPVAENDTACPEPALIGAATDGSILLCLTDTGSVTGYQWSGPYRVAEAVREENGTCAAAAGATARTAAGLALVCEDGAWTLWVS
ncbi:hypothetical protein IU448_01920 [Nocardia flavorosea]|uniref:hypothetical protein n=1 Tax=Nocardia flavorosea TaxID=53429 RepID=UPI0018959E1C|nr:hypothetical protein [Nocardia flavorosea]MBF6347770.1 hypothetical protein [Nocardia flavorosea]